MTRFNDCLAHILISEGGFVDHPSDKGGATNRGITQATYDKYRTDLGDMLKSVEHIAMHEVSAIYKHRYWDACCCGDLRPPLDMAVFDAAVQHGPKRASRWLQNLVCATPDGVIGHQTLRAVNYHLLRYKLRTMIDAYQRQRALFYAKIIANDPTQKVFERGWKNRLASVNKLLEVA